MPKSKKKKRQDFQKVKLKVGKRLPKGDNVTNLSFKTRQIQLTQRIKDDAGQELVTKKKQNAQDLLRQCDHHSSNSRLNAVMGLRELWLNNHSEMMVPTNVHGYTAVLKKLSGLLIDSDAAVRHAVVNLFKLILHKITKDSAHPGTNLLGGSLFTHIHAFLGCAMNHVLEDIRLDALLLYDALLDAGPSLMVQQTGGLLRNLVGLLAPHSQGQVGARGDTTTQKLSLNPESRLPVMVFRAKVLSRIKQTLVAAVNDQSESSLLVAKESPDALKTWSLHDDLSVRKNQQTTMILSRHVWQRFNMLNNGGSHELDDYITNPSSLESFIHQCVPILIQCWKEAQADTESQNESVSMLSSCSIDVISLVVSVLQLLFALAVSKNRRNEKAEKHLVQLEMIANTYLKPVGQLMMGGFPYSAQLDVSGNQKKQKRKKDKIGSVSTCGSQQASLTTLNLGICDIMSNFCLDPATKLDKKWLKKMNHHLLVTLKQNPSMDHYRTIARVMRNVFSNPQASDFFTKVYKMSFELYSSTTTKSQQKKLLYGIFSFMGQTWDGWSKSGIGHRLYSENPDLEEILKVFFQGLPHLSLSVKQLVGQEQWTLDLLRLMCHSHARMCCNGFDDVLSQVLDPVQGLFVSADEEIQHQLCAIISSGSHFSKENYRQLLQLMRSPIEKPIIRVRRSWSCLNRLLFAIFANIRASVPMRNQQEFHKMTAEKHQQLSNYLRFLFSLQIGFTGEELDLLCPAIAERKSEPSWFNIEFSLTESQWERHIEVSKIVAREVANFSLPPAPSQGYQESFSFVNNFEHFWTQTFVKRDRMHILSVIGLAHFVLHTQQPSGYSELSSRELVSLASLGLAAALAALYDQQNLVTGGSKSGQMQTNLTWRMKEELTHLLVNFPSIADKGKSSPILFQVMENLKRRAKGEFGGLENEHQAAKSAQDFLLTDEILKQRLEAMNSRFKK